jgi:hypothetical protein
MKLETIEEFKDWVLALNQDIVKVVRAVDKETFQPKIRVVLEDGSDYEYSIITALDSAKAFSDVKEAVEKIGPVPKTNVGLGLDG